MQLVKTTITNHTNGFLRMETSRGFEDIQVDPKSSRTYPFDLFTILPESYHQGLLEAVKNGEYDITVTVSNPAADYGLVLEGNQDEEVRWMKQQVSKDMEAITAGHRAELTKRCEECTIRKEWIKLSYAAKAEKAEKPVKPAAPAETLAKNALPPTATITTPSAAPAVPPATAVKVPTPAPKAAPSGTPDTPAANNAGGFSQWTKKTPPAATTKPKVTKQTK